MNNSTKSGTPRFWVSALIALGVAAVVWMTVAWPLPRYMTSGIASSQRPEQGGARAMIAGDHLQLLYFFQLMSGFLSGRTPWFHNLYEFNEGDDSARWIVDYYYAPFSVVYALGEKLGGPAFGWNLASLVSLWLGALGGMLLAARFATSRAVILTAALVATLLPYRMVTIFHGSPTGFGIAYVPFILFGLDRAIRDRSAPAAALAGAFLLLSGWADTHTFFFAGIVTPFWCVFVFLYEGVRIDRRRILTTARALIPFILFGALIVLQVWWTHRILESTVMQKGRSIREVMIFSPSWQGFLNTNPDHPNSYIYLTFTLALLAIAAVGVGIARTVRAPSADTIRRSALHLLLLAGIGIILLLSLGPRMPVPSADVWWNRLCTVFPPYSMIRQPAKVFCLLPSLLTVFLALPFAGWLPRRRTWVTGVAAGAIAVVWTAEVSWRLTPAVCLIGSEQRAYAAIRADAGRRGEPARAIAVPLWPGDSHWSSLYQHFGVRYGIRMINGYSPLVPLGYKERVFHGFESVNRGHISITQFETLRSRGFRYLVVHEDAFPERVSPFGVAQTLAAYLADPRFRLLEQHGAVWAFELLDEPDAAASIAVPWNVASVTHRWDAERGFNGPPEAIETAGDCHGGRFVRLRDSETRIVFPRHSMVFADDLRFMVRLRGEGALKAVFSFADGSEREQTLPVSATEWAWAPIAFPPFEGFEKNIVVRLEAVTGVIDIDYGYVARGDLPPTAWPPGAAFRIPAPSLFHAGYTRLERDAVRLDPLFVQAGAVVYGPGLPLPKGRYRIEMHYESEASDQVLGMLAVREPVGVSTPASGVQVTGGGRVAALTLDQQANLPLSIEFQYYRSAVIDILFLEIIRLDDDA